MSVARSRTLFADEVRCVGTRALLMTHEKQHIVWGIKFLRLARVRRAHFSRVILSRDPVAWEYRFCLVTEFRRLVRSNLLVFIIVLRRVKWDV